MVSVYLLNLIIYISLNPIKLAVYHIKIALSRLSPARLNYCWKGPYSSVLGAFLSPRQRVRLGWDVYGAETKSLCSSQPTWPSSRLCLLVMAESCGPSKRDSSTLASCLPSGAEMSLGSAGLLLSFVLRVDYWSSPVMWLYDSRLLLAGSVGGWQP